MEGLKNSRRWHTMPRREILPDDPCYAVADEEFRSNGNCDTIIIGWTDVIIRPTEEYRYYRVDTGVSDG